MTSSADVIEGMREALAKAISLRIEKHRPYITYATVCHWRKDLETPGRLSSNDKRIIKERIEDEYFGPADAAIEIIRAALALPDSKPDKGGE